MGVWRIAAIVALGAGSLAATASGGAPPRVFTHAATRACLTRLPDAVVGLPPTTPPDPPAMFVYSFPRDRLPPRAQGELGVWSGRTSYDGITLSFFSSARDARASFKEIVSLYGGKLVGNVVVAWSGAVPPRSLQRTVLGCLRAGPAVGRTPLRAPQATLATFAGYWGGHGRGLRIGADGRAGEGDNDGCCTRVYQMTYRILSVSGTITRATAVYRVTSFRRYVRDMPRLRVGRRGKLLLRNGIVTNALTRDYFCSGPAWGATGACGA